MAVWTAVSSDLASARTRTRTRRSGRSFDIVNHLGVLYHLSDMLLSLRQVTGGGVGSVLGIEGVATLGG